MVNYYYVVLVVAAFAFNGTTALERLPKEYDEFKINAYKIVYRCGHKYNIDIQTIQKAIDDTTIQYLDPCFLGCVFENTEMMTDKGYVTPVEGVARLKPYISSRKYTNILNAFKQCANTVNSQSPKDTCESGSLLASCLVDAYIRLWGKADQA